MMKRIIALTLIICSYTLQAQEELKLKFVIENSSQISSTVVIGRDGSATAGIDVAFNEENIYGMEWGEVDLRSIQRTEDLHECLNSSVWDNSGEPLYFENNADLKVDMRNLNFGDFYNSCFELKIHANGYPLNLTVDASNWGPYSMHFFIITLFKNHCEFAKEIELFNGEITNLVIQESDSIERIVARLTHEVSVKEHAMGFFEIVPNPVTTRGIIQFNNRVQGKIEIYSITGTKVYEADSRNKISISSAQFNTGLYIVKYSDECGNIDLKKLVIQ